MPPYRVRTTDAVVQLVRHLHPLLKAKVRAAVQAIAADPYVGKALKEDLAGLRSYRVGGFRLIYQVVNERYVEIIAVGPRHTIYEDTFRLIRREQD